MTCCSQSGLLNGESDALGDTSAVLGVNLVQMLDEALLDISTALTESTRDVVHDLLAHLIIEDLAEEGAWLLIVVIGVGVSVATGLARHLLLSPGVDAVLNGGAADGVGLVVGLGAVAAIDGHEAVAGVVVTHASAVGAVDRDLVVVRSKSVSVGVRVIDETALEHLVVGWFNTWDHVGGCEGRLLSLSVVILWVLVQNQLSNLLERVVAMGPHLGDIVDVETVGSGISDGHNLGIPGPRGEVALLDLVVEIISGPVLVLLAHLSG